MKTTLVKGLTGKKVTEQLKHQTYLWLVEMSLEMTDPSTFRNDLVMLLSDPDSAPRLSRCLEVIRKSLESEDLRIGWKGLEYSNL